MTVEKYDKIIGKVFGKVVKTDDTIDFYFDANSNENPEYRLMHFQSCCERVWVEDVNGDLNDLVGGPITLAEKSTQEPDGLPEYESATWTFIRIGTAKGMVVVRFYGESNGYYSEDADFAEFDKKYDTYYLGGYTEVKP